MAPYTPDLGLRLRGKLSKKIYGTSLGEEQHLNCSLYKNGIAGEAKTTCKKKLMG